MYAWQALRHGERGKKGLTNQQNDGNGGSGGGVKLPPNPNNIDLSSCSKTDMDLAKSKVRPHLDYVRITLDDDLALHICELRGISATDLYSLPSVYILKEVKIKKGQFNQKNLTFEMSLSPDQVLTLFRGLPHVINHFRKKQLLPPPSRPSALLFENKDDTSGRGKKIDAETAAVLISALKTASDITTTAAATKPEDGNQQQQQQQQEQQGEDVTGCR